MIGEKQGSKLNKYVPDYVLFDLETTGISVNSDAVIEISAVKVRGGKIVEEFSHLVNPERSIPYYASQVNGITDDMVKDCPVFKEVLADFLKFIGDDILVGHNIHAFDMKFIYRDVKKYYGKIISNDYIDTLVLSKMYFPEMKHHRLSDMADCFGISVAGAHRALNDCKMNQQVYECMATGMKSKSSKNIMKCPQCGSMLKRRNGKFGEFYGCMSYPNCRYTRNI